MPSSEINPACLDGLALEPVVGWAGSARCRARVVHPETVERVGETLAAARGASRSVAFRGKGLSSGDAFLNDGNVIVDLSRLNALLDWDPATGVMTCQPGMLVADVLATSLGDNWVLTAVPGTRWLSVGGAIANSVHGKNSYREGSFGECVQSIKLILACGDVVTCSRTSREDLFRAAVGGAGIFGPIVEATLQLKRVPSPFLRVRHFTVRSIEEMIDRIDREKDAHDYIIGQVDALVRGRRLGRGTIHVGDFIDAAAEGVPDHVNSGVRPRLFNVIPKPWVVSLSRVFMSDLTMRAVTAGKYYADSMTRSRRGSIQSFYDFTFLLDQLPGWQTCYRRGFVEQQALVPYAHCRAALRSLIEMAQQAGCPSLFTAVKAHRGDDCLTSFGLDGMSITFDLPVKRDDTESLDRLVREMNELVRSVGGQMYLAKDQTMTHEQFVAMYPDAKEAIRLKRQYDPQELFQSDLYRRLYGGTLT